MTIAVIMVNTDWAKANPELVQHYYSPELRGVRDIAMPITAARTARR